MGRTVITATLRGEGSSKEYEFLVDTGATHVGLPAEEIAQLRLSTIPKGRTRLLTATGVVERQTYAAQGEVAGRGFVATVTEAPIPIVGYELLESLRLKVNPVNKTLEDVPDEDLSPPYPL